jgi:Na+/proline symporter
MHPLDALILLAFVLYAVASGLAGRRAASRNLGEYFLAGRSLTGTRAGLSMAATQFSADTPLLVTGLIATTGIFGLWRLWIYALAFLLLGFLLAPCWRRAGVLTDAELSELRYGGRGALLLRGVKAVYFGLVFNCAVLAMVLFAAARIAEPFLQWHAWLPPGLFQPVLAAVRAVGVPLTQMAGAQGWVASADNLLSLLAILFLTTFYSTTGGLRSVVRTDLGQLALALGGTLLYALFVVDAAGGWSTLASRLAQALDAHPQGLQSRELLAFTPGEAPSAVGGAMLAVLGLQWLIQMNADGTGYLAQRCMACRSDADATRATLVFAWVQIFLRSLLWLPIGVGLLVVYAPDGDAAGFVAGREATYVRGMAELLPVGVRGVLLTAMLAALASTLDTHLNWGASYLTNDLYGRLYCGALQGRRPEQRELVRVARVSNLLIVVLALGIMTQLSSIQTAWQVSLLLGAGMGVMLLLRWLWWRVTAAGELASIVASSVLAPVLVATVPDSREALRLLLVAAGSTLAGVGVSLLSPAAPSDGAREFYARVRPPGFWGRLATEQGEAARAPRRRMIRGLTRTAAAAFSLFCALVGVGSWLVGGTVPGWFAAPALWSPTLLAIAAVLTPVYLQSESE